jgi:regulator of protease activity HflC (stomatin/prohibitin superfamily)
MPIDTERNIMGSLTGRDFLTGGSFVLLVFLLAGIRMVGPAGRGLVERLGKYWRLAMPGLKRKSR